MSVFELFSSLFVKTQNTMKKDGTLQSEIFLLHSFSVNDFPFLIILKRRPLYDTLRKDIALDFFLFVPCGHVFFDSNSVVISVNFDS